MKKILIYFWLMAFVLALLPVKARAQISYQSNMSNVSVNFQDTVVGGVTYRAYTVDGMGVTGTPECPQVPKQIMRFSIPYNAKNIAVQVTGGQSQTTGTLPFKIIPVIPDRPICDSLPEVLTADSTVYHTNAYYPANAAEMMGEGFYMGENHIVTVAAYPIQYNPVTNKIKRNKRVNFTISYNLVGDSLCDVLVRDDFTLRQQGWDEVKTMVMNPNQVENFAPTETTCQFLNMQYIPDSLQTHLNDSIAYGGELYAFDINPCDYMIITTQELAPSFRRLAALKRQKGLTTEIHCIENILNNPFVQCGDSIPRAQYPIKDDAGKLRQYLRLCFKYKNTQFVLFGGNEVPHRIGYNDYMYGKFYRVPTDLYYSNLTTNWDKDNDEFYGECSLYNAIGDLFDFSPQLYIGRLMAFEPSHIHNYTNKLFRYELAPASYVGKCLVVHGAEFCFACDSAQYLYPTIFTASESLNQTRNSSYYWPTGEDVINEISSNPHGFVSLQGHGNPAQISVNNWGDITHYRIATLDIADTEPNNGVDLLNNKYSPFVIYSLACSTMPFNKIAHDNAQHFYNRYINIAQSFTLGKNYGGVAFIGNTNSGLKRSSSNLENCFASNLLKYSKIGVVESMSKDLNTMKYGYFESTNGVIGENHTSYANFVHNLMGDPEFDIWTDIPSCFTGITVFRNDNSITVSGITSDSTIVAICGNSTYPQRKNATNGTAFFNNVSPNSSVMVYQHNYLPYIAPLYIQNATLSHSQYVIASDAYLGKTVDSNRTTGDVVIPANVNYEMEYTGNVLLAPGFTVEKGATLSVVPSDY